MIRNVRPAELETRTRLNWKSPPCPVGKVRHHIQHEVVPVLAMAKTNKHLLRCRVQGKTTVFGAMANVTSAVEVEYMMNLARFVKTYPKAAQPSTRPFDPSPGPATSRLLFDHLALALSLIHI